MKAYKLTDENFLTKNNTKWGEGVTHKIEDLTIGPLCSSSWIHFYTDPLIAVLMNPAHANFSNPILWESEASEPFLHESLKSGCKSLTTLKQIELPSITLINKVAFGILCTKKVVIDIKWNKWADNWLNNINRSYAAASYAATTYSIAAYDKPIDFIKLANQALTIK